MSLTWMISVCVPETKLETMVPGTAVTPSLWKSWYVIEQAEELLVVNAVNVKDSSTLITS